MDLSSLALTRITDDTIANEPHNSTQNRYTVTFYCHLLKLPVVFFFVISLETADSLAAAAAVSAVSFVIIGTVGGGGEAGTASVFNITELASRCYWLG